MNENIPDTGKVVEVDPYANGHWILVFDGRVLEIFGPNFVGGGVNWTTIGDSWRIHVRHLNVKATGPDKHGLRELRFQSLDHPYTKGGIANFTDLNDEQWNRFQPLLDALATRTDAGPWPSASEVFTAKLGKLQGLLRHHDVHLATQPDDIRDAVVVDLRAAGVPVDPSNLGVTLTDLIQIEALLDVYKRHGLLPRDAALD